MAFIQDNFQPIGGQAKRSKAPQRFSYSTLDAAATLDTSGYFNSVYNLLEVGDIIDRVTWSTAIGAGGTISTYGSHIVMTKSGGVIDVSDTTAGTVTNTD